MCRLSASRPSRRLGVACRGRVRYERQRFATGLRRVVRGEMRHSPASSNVASRADGYQDRVVQEQAGSRMAKCLLRSAKGIEVDKTRGGEVRRRGRRLLEEEEEEEEGRLSYATSLP